MWFKINADVLQRITNGRNRHCDAYLIFRDGEMGHPRIVTPAIEGERREESISFNHGGSRELRCLAAQLLYLADRIDREEDENVFSVV